MHHHRLPALQGQGDGRDLRSGPVPGRMARSLTQRQHRGRDVSARLRAEAGLGPDIRSRRVWGRRGHQPARPGDVWPLPGHLERDQRQNQGSQGLSGQNDIRIRLRWRAVQERATAAPTELRQQHLQHTDHPRRTRRPSVRHSPPCALVASSKAPATSCRERNRTPCRRRCWNCWPARASQLSPRRTPGTRRQGGPIHPG